MPPTPRPPPASHRLRRGRISEAGRPYLLTMTTARREPVFRHFPAACAVAQTLLHLGTAGRAQTLAWVVMPDHLHWLLAPAAENSLPALAHSAKSYTAQRINRMLERRGRIWQPGYHDHAVRYEEDLRALARYVITNPVRAGLVKRVGDYPFWDAAWL